MEPNDVVRELCASFETGNVDELMRGIADDCVYHDIPLDPITGAEAIRTALEGFGEMLGEMRFEVRCQVATGNLVLNERIDHFTLPDGRRGRLPVAGVFEVRDGKIVITSTPGSSRRAPESRSADGPGGGPS